MRSHTEQLNKIRFGSRITRPGQEATALAEADRAKPDLSQVKLETVLLKSEVRFSDEVLEDQIEQGGFAETLRTLMAEAVGRDIEELIVNGDTGSADAYLALLDGILAQASSNVVAAGGIKLQKSILRDMLKAMPSEFKAMKDQMRFITSENAKIDYGDTLADRQTGLGDNQLSSGDAGGIGYQGVRLMEVPLFPEDLGVGSDETNVVLTDPKNIAVGFWRRVRFERDRIIGAGVNLFVATTRVDVKYEEETAVVKATGVLVS
jgi:hypothetical protein